MEFSIDIDTGGTFTDGYVRGNGRVVLAKVDTTPHDRTVCFMECIEEAAGKLGFESATDLLVQTDTLRLSTTIGTNALIQASGPKLGLLATKGRGDNGYVPSGAANPAIDFVIPKDMIIGIEEEINEAGEVVKSPDGPQVLAAVKRLLERGARRIVVSLARSPLNADNEKKVRDIVLADYPAHYLGTVPLLLSTEISSEMDDFHRTNAALIDAYIHQDMVHYLYKADEDVRNRRYRWPLLIVHATGGAARVAKTKAIDTCDSGPAAGLFGAAYIARMYGLENVITIDVGGTSTDIGLIAKGELNLTTERKMGGIPVRERVIETVSIGGGGSSVTWLDDKKNFRVGPESSGAIPGPACYGLGGYKATVADAWVTLGYIDPDYFLGGRRRLDIKEATTAIREQLAEPEGLTVEQAAEAAVKKMSVQSADYLKEFIASKGLTPGEVTMFAFGGAGGLACAGMAREAGIHRIYFFPFGAQFCAFGSSCTDVLHNYTNAMKLVLDPGAAASAVKEFNAAAKTMRDDAYFDMEGEGFGKKKVTLNMSLTLTSKKAPSPAVIAWPQITMKDKDDITSLLEQFRAQTGAPANDPVILKEIVLQASCPLTHPEFPEYTSSGEDPSAALKGQRQVFWEGESRQVPVYSQENLKCGNVVRGLAIIESVDTTILVPPGSRYMVDRYLNGVMEEE